MTRSTEDARELLIALNAAPDLTRATICRLAADLSAWRDAGGGDPAAGAGLPRAAIERALGARRRAAGVARRELAAARTAGARIVTCLDPDYPARLRDLTLPPPVLFVAGELADRPAIAIVGSRRASPYGLEVARWFGGALAEAGALVVSGFAIGIDGAAHRGAIAAPRGATAAVLGCGLDIDYPRSHKRLACEIRARGALVTEYPCGTPPEPWRFPVRNRILAALARVVVVVEAAPRSGSLITARLALDLGREVLAVPGRLTDEVAVGTNALLADGAAPALSPEDLLPLLGLADPPSGSLASPIADVPLPPGLGGVGRALVDAADPQRPATADALAARAGVPIEQALAALLELELAGVLQRQPGGALLRTAGRGGAR